MLKFVLKFIKSGFEVENRIVRYTFYLAVATVTIAVATKLLGIYGILLAVVILFAAGKYLTR